VNPIATRALLAAVTSLLPLSSLPPSLAAAAFPGVDTTQPSAADAVNPSIYLPPFYRATDRLDPKGKPLGTVLASEPVTS
jgi:hypothetical protein